MDPETTILTTIIITETTDLKGRIGKGDRTQVVLQ